MSGPTATSHFDWADLAFSSKRPLKDLHATFIAAPRELSTARFKQLIKTYLPRGNIVIGLSATNYVAGFENQPQFATLRLTAIQRVIDQVNSSGHQRQIVTLTYQPHDEPHIIAKDLFGHYVFVNGSWHSSFHLRPSFYALAKLRASYELVSPFTSETEAAQYLENIWPHVLEATPLPKAGALLSASKALEVAAIVGRRSFDHTFQTGVAIAHPVDTDRYQFITATYNGVVPHQTYALHHGSSREQHFSPAGDLNHYDTNHAEMALLVKAATEHLDLAGATMFINLLPCPTCARILSTTALREIVYRLDHSAGYAIRLFNETNKNIRQIQI